MRAEIISRIDPAKAIAYFQRTQGWSKTVTTQQVLTPLRPQEIRGTSNADDTSIMCYQLPGSITKDGRPIPGGNDLSDYDKAFVTTIYPKTTGPIDPPDPVDPAPTSVEVKVGKTLLVKAVA